MKLSPALIPLALISTVFTLSVQAAGNLTVAPGETYTVDAAHQRMTLESLTLGRGARIEFGKGVRQWLLRARRVKIGSDVVIDASGKSGAAGAAGKGFSTPAAACSDGRIGGNGDKGADGRDGVSLHLQLGLASLGSLKVLSNGGAGGSGGAAGNGQDAGDFSRICGSAPSGGAAGSGGNGGNGGNAGDVTVSFWPVGHTIDAARVPDLIAVRADAGAGGAGGAQGKPGRGTEGHYVDRRSLTGTRAWAAGGKPGAKGRPGAAGRAGRAGRVLVEQALVNMQPVVEPAPVKANPAAASKRSSESHEEEIRQIRQTLESLSKRLDKLEQQK